MDQTQPERDRLTFAAAISVRRSFLALAAILAVTLASGPAWGRGGGGGFGGRGGGDHAGPSFDGHEPGESGHFDGDRSPHVDHDRGFHSFRGVPFYDYDPYDSWVDPDCDPYSPYYEPDDC